MYACVDVAAAVHHLYVYKRPHIYNTAATPAAKTPATKRLSLTMLLAAAFPVEPAEEAEPVALDVPLAELLLLLESEELSAEAAPKTPP